MPLLPKAHEPHETFQPTGSAHRFPDMSRLLILTDPLGGSTSVQLELLLSIGTRLKHQYSIAVYTPHCGSHMAEVLRGAGFQLFLPSDHGYNLNRILRRFGHSNESMLWAEGWIREVLFQSNQLDAQRVLEGRSFDRVLNMSSTVTYPSDVWWIQGLPLDSTLRGMAGVNPVAGIAYFGSAPLVRWLDNRQFERMRRVSRKIIGGSPFVSEVFRARGVATDGTVYSVKDFGNFHPPTSHPTRDYVLLYVGKETEELDFLALKTAGVRIVGFGCKIPAATQLRRFTDWIEFRGYVPDAELANLYANAMFTVFPFTVEALGYVPIESMACGTPVLTYGRQGPGATVIDGVTGWFVQTAQEMVAKAVEIWHRGVRDGISTACVRRAQDFSVGQSVNRLVGLIEDPSGH